ncbi:MAG: hypothetical protein KF752_11435 [Pirellulaceae bacterium]|nr:hypothetical protein [Pirellulaceae bacterium]
MVRIDQPPTNSVGQGLYRRNVQRWLAQHYRQFDVLWCDDPCDMVAPTALTFASQSHWPSVVRHDPTPDTSDSDTQLDDAARASLVNCCENASTILVTSVAAQQQCLKLIGATDKIVRFSDWPGPALDRSPSARRAARSCLSDANSDLALHTQDQLVIVPAEFNGRWNLRLVVGALESLLEVSSRLRLWILGDGPERESFYDCLQGMGLHRIVVLPGMFSCVDTVMQAADLCLLPTAGCGQSWYLPTCMVSGIPFLVAHSAQWSGRYGQTRLENCFDGSAGELRAKVQEWLRNPAQLAQSTKIAGQAYRKHCAAVCGDGGLAKHLGLTLVANDRVNTKT